MHRTEQLLAKSQRHCHASTPLEDAVAQSLPELDGLLLVRRLPLPAEKAAIFFVDHHIFTWKGVNVICGLNHGGTKAKAVKILCTQRHLARG